MRICHSRKVKTGPLTYGRPPSFPDPRPPANASAHIARPMPLSFRIAGVDVSLGGAPHAAQVSALSTSSRAASIGPYPSVGQAATASPPGYRINTLSRVIGTGTHAWRKAAKALETADALETPWVRFWRQGHALRWAKGDVVVVVARVLPFVWTSNVNKVVAVQRRRRSLSVAWGTTSRHVLRGEEVVSVSKKENGDVVFDLRSFSRPHAFMAWLSYPLVMYLQAAFARDVCRQLAEAANDSS